MQKFSIIPTGGIMNIINTILIFFYWLIKNQNKTLSNDDNFLSGNDMSIDIGDDC
jgi:hypothetical protein